MARNPEPSRSLVPAPTVSVIIPAFNRAKTLGEAVQSALDQTFTNLEVVVVDDGSSDDTAQAAYRFKDPRLRVIRHYRNKGLSAARNTGIETARGRFIAFLDSDDRWLPHKIAVQLPYLHGQPTRIAAIFSAYNIIFATNKRQRHYPKTRQPGLNHFLHGNPIGAPLTALVRTEVLRELAGFDNRMMALEDRELWIRLAERYECIATSDCVAEYHKGSPDQVSANPTGMANGRRYILAKHKGLYSPMEYLRARARAHALNGRDYWLNGQRARGTCHLLTALSIFPFGRTGWCILVRHFLLGRPLGIRGRRDSTWT